MAKLLTDQLVCSEPRVLKHNQGRAIDRRPLLGFTEIYDPIHLFHGLEISYRLRSFPYPSPSSLKLLTNNAQAFSGNNATFCCLSCNSMVVITHILDSLSFFCFSSVVVLFATSCCFCWLSSLSMRLTGWMTWRLCLSAGIRSLFVVVILSLLSCFAFIFLFALPLVRQLTFLTLTLQSPWSALDVSVLVCARPSV